MDYTAHAVSIYSTDLVGDVIAPPRAFTCGVDLVAPGPMLDNAALVTEMTIITFTNAGSSDTASGFSSKPILFPACLLTLCSFIPAALRIASY